MEISQSYKINISILCLIASSFIHPAVITNAGNAGYLGDQLMNYIKAKYLSHKYHIPFHLRPFQHCEKFMLDILEPKLSSQDNRLKKIDLANEQNLSNGNHLYNVSYYCNMHGWSDSFDTYSWESALNDKQFMSEIKRFVALKKDIIIEQPDDAISVAVHVRRPSNADHNELTSSSFYNINDLYRHQDINRFAMDKPFPFKFHPDQYYVDQIQRISNMFPDKPIHVHIFTDSTQPQLICDQYKKKLNNSRITFFYKSNHYSSSVAEDLIALSKFDYLIRSKSNFSQIADFIGHHKIVISSDRLGWYKNQQEHDCLVIETIIIKTRNKDGSYNKKIINNM